MKSATPFLWKFIETVKPNDSKTPYEENKSVEEKHELESTLCIVS